jgi:hypothetical protein
VILSAASSASAQVPAAPFHVALNVLRDRLRRGMLAPGARITAIDVADVLRLSTMPSPGWPAKVTAARQPPSPPARRGAPVRRRPEGSHRHVES